MTPPRAHRSLMVALLLSAGAAAFAAPPAQTSNGMLVGPNGMTLYTFDKDTAGTGKSACSGPCATAWPPLMAPADAKAEGDWSVITRDDGAKQWAYKGKPLYYFQKDTAAGDKNGDNMRDVWHIAK